METNAWLDGINKEADEKAKELSLIFCCEVTPFVFVVENEKDAAVGFLRKPNVEQTFKILRAPSEYSALELTARAQLIRDEDVAQFQKEGSAFVSASDKRFMDKDGKYHLEDTTLNTSLILRMNQVVEIVRDSFKKK